MGHDAEKVFYLRLVLDVPLVEGFVEGCPERIGEDDPDGEALCGPCGRRTRGSRSWRRLRVG